MKSIFNTLEVSNKNMKTMTAQNTRADIIGELEAIILYQSHIDSTDDASAKQTLHDIIMEEKLHVGQLFGLLFKLDPDSKAQFEKGYTEFVEQNSN